MKIRIYAMILGMCMLLGGCRDTDIGIIGGADGPTQILVAEQGEEAMYQQITAEEARQIMDSKADIVILDVREQNEFDAGHVPGAILIPYEQIPQEAEKVIPDKDQQILVYCRSGRRSKIAAESLNSLGYTHVQEFGGIIDWPYDIEK